MNERLCEGIGRVEYDRNQIQLKSKLGPYGHFDKKIERERERASAKCRKLAYTTWNNELYNRREREIESKKYIHCHTGRVLFIVRCVDVCVCF